MESKKLILKNHLVSYKVSKQNQSTINLVFIHGWLSSKEVWSNLIKRIDFANCFTLDLPGFGESQVPTNSVNNDFFVEIVKEFIDKLNLKNVVLVGHSNGGAIATKFTTKYKSSLNKLILIDSSGIRNKTLKKMIFNSVAKILKPIFSLKILSGLKNRIYKMIGSSDYIESNHIKGTYINVINEDISSIYSPIDSKTLIIWGKQDKDTPIEFAHFINKEIKDSKLVELNAGHFPFIEKESEVLASIKEFLK